MKVPLIRVLVAASALTLAGAGALTATLALSPPAVAGLGPASVAAAVTNTTAMAGQQRETGSEQGLSSSAISRGGGTLTGDISVLARHEFLPPITSSSPLDPPDTAGAMSAEVAGAGPVGTLPAGTSPRSSRSTEPGAAGGQRTAAPTPDRSTTPAASSSLARTVTAAPHTSPASATPRTSASRSSTSSRTPTSQHPSPPPAGPPTATLPTTRTSKGQPATSAPPATSQTRSSTSSSTLSSSWQPPNVPSTSTPPTSTPGNDQCAPDWSATANYRPGDVVSYQGRVYRSLWWSTGVEPGSRIGYNIWFRTGRCR